MRAGLSLILALLLGGCTTQRVTLIDGRVIEQETFLARATLDLPDDGGTIEASSERAIWIAIAGITMYFLDSIVSTVKGAETASEAIKAGPEILEAEAARQIGIEAQQTARLGSAVGAN